MDIDSIIKVITFLGKLITAVFALYGAHSLVYKKSPKYYFLLKRLTSRWKDSKWNLTASFQTSLNAPSFFQGLFATLSSFSKEKALSFQIIFKNQNKQQFQIDDFIFTVQYNFDAKSTKPFIVEFKFAPITATYKTALQKITLLKLLLHQTESDLSLQQSRYALDIHFLNITNPFYGIMLNRIGADKVKSFNCSINLRNLISTEFKNKAFNSNVNIYKNKISINESSFDQLEYTAKKCLMIGE